jgi:hypothetical protein
MAHQLMRHLEIRVCNLSYFFACGQPPLQQFGVTTLTPVMVTG